MIRNTHQSKNWGGEFGEKFTKRYFQTYEESDEGYKKLYGVTRTEMNRDFLGGFDREITILEVGAHIGVQLSSLQNLGFKHLYGIDVQRYAIEFSKQKLRDVDIIEGSALNIPFKDGYFDLVFTSVVLIHISPNDINKALDEIYRCSKKYIWGFEYYADKLTEVEYRGEKNMLWKTNFSQLYLKRFPDLELIKEEKYKYIDDNNVDSMFLLRKRNIK